MDAVDPVAELPQRTPQYLFIADPDDLIGAGKVEEPAACCA